MRSVVAELLAGSDAKGFEPGAEMEAVTSEPNGGIGEEAI
jgi:hypothetical protein